MISNIARLNDKSGFVTSLHLWYFGICDKIGFAMSMYLWHTWIYDNISFMISFNLLCHCICDAIVIGSVTLLHLWHYRNDDVLEFVTLWICVVIRFVTYWINDVIGSVTLLDLQRMNLRIMTDWNQSGPNLMKNYVISYTICRKPTFIPKSTIYERHLSLLEYSTLAVAGKSNWRKG